MIVLHRMQGQVSYVLRFAGKCAMTNAVFEVDLVWTASCCEWVGLHSLMASLRKT